MDVLANSDEVCSMALLCSAGEWWLLEVSMVCAKGCGSGTVLRAVCACFCWKVHAEICEILQVIVFSIVSMGRDPMGPRALIAALQEL